MRDCRPLWSCAWLLIVLSACTHAPEQPAPIASREAMVAAADPLAVEAGLEILRAGGSALDAAIAVELVLGLVEPESSGVGGGGFLVHYRSRDRAIDAYDGREWAPAGATPGCFWTTTASRCLLNWRRPAGARSARRR